MWDRFTIATVLVGALVTGCGLAPANKLVSANIPRAPSQESAALEEAVATVAEARYEEAAARLSPLTVKFEAANDRRRSAESLFWLAYCYEKLGRTGDAARLYRQVIEQYNSQPPARQAARRLSVIPEADRIR